MNRRLTLMIVLNIAIFILGLNVILWQSKPGPFKSAQSRDDPNRFQALLNQGRRFFMMGKEKSAFLVGAIRSFDDAIAEKPQDLAGYLILGQTLMKLGSLEGAIDIFESALIIFPEEGLLNYLLAQCYSGLHDKGLAVYFARASMKNFQDINNPAAYAAAKALWQQISRQ